MGNNPCGEKGGEEDKTKQREKLNFNVIARIASAGLTGWSRTEYFRVVPI